MHNAVEKITASVSSAAIHYVSDFAFLYGFFGLNEEWIGPAYSGLDIETEAVLSPHDGEPATVQIELDEDCWVVHWSSTQRLKDVAYVELFQSYLIERSVTKVIHNASFELSFFLDAFGKDLRCGPVHDTMGAEYILSEGSGFDEDTPRCARGLLGLGAVVMRRYGVEMDKDKALRTSFRRKGTVYDEPPVRVGHPKCGHPNCESDTNWVVGSTGETFLCSTHVNDPQYARLRIRVAVTPDEFLPRSVTVGDLSPRQLQYAAFDALWCAALAKDQMEEMGIKDVHDGEKFTSLFEIDCAATDVVARMQYAGIPVDFETMLCLDAEFQYEAELLRDRILDQTSLTSILEYIHSKGEYDMTYETLAEEMNVSESKSGSKPATELANLKSHQQMLARLNRLGIPTPSYEGFELKRFSDNELCKTILDWKLVDRLQNSYTSVLVERTHRVTGRIHCSINQFNTATGRFSIEKPALQQLPSRTKEGRRIRGAIKAGDGRTLVIADYSQIELRLIAEMYQDITMSEAFRSGKDLHSLFAAKILGISYDELEAGKNGPYKDARSYAKPGNFGLGYGAGVSQFISICWTQYGINLTIEEATTIRAMWLELFAGVAMYHESMKRRIRNGTGPMRFYTQDGRVRRLPREWRTANGERKTAYAAGLNHPIQGSSADMIKKVMIELTDQYLTTHRHTNADLILQVHDELITECDEEHAEAIKKLVQYTMLKIGQTYFKTLPVDVDVKVSKCWTK